MASDFLKKQAQRQAEKVDREQGKGAYGGSQWRSRKAMEAEQKQKAVSRLKGQSAGGILPLSPMGAASLQRAAEQRAKEQAESVQSITAKRDAAALEAKKAQATMQAIQAGGWLPGSGTAEKATSAMETLSRAQREQGRQTARLTERAAQAQAQRAAERAERALLLPTAETLEQRTKEAAQARYGAAAERERYQGWGFLLSPGTAEEKAERLKNAIQTERETAPELSALQDDLQLARDRDYLRATEARIAALEQGAAGLDASRAPDYASAAAGRERRAAETVRALLDDTVAAQRTAAGDAEGVWNATRLQFLTEQERDVLLGYAGAGQWDKAADYLDAMERTLNRKQQTENSTIVREGTADNVFTRVGGAVMNAASSYLQPLAYLEGVKQVVKNAYTGEYEPIDANSFWMSGAHLSQDTAAGVTEGLNPKTAFLLETGLSVLQNMVRYPLGPLALPLMAVGAGGSSVLEGTQQGISPGETLALATAAGFAEYATEKLPLENMFKLVGGNAKGLYAMLLGFFKQVATEAGEEALSEYANLLADAVIRGDQSEMMEHRNALVDAGFSEHEADAMTITQYLVKDPALAALGGAISGGVMGGLGTAIGHVRGNMAQQNAASTGETATTYAQEVLDGIYEGADQESGVMELLRNDEVTANPDTEIGWSEGTDGAQFAAPKITQEQMQRNAEELSEQQSVVRLTGKEFPNTGASLIDRVAAFFTRAYQNRVTNQELGTVILNRRGAKDSLRKGLSDGKSIAFAAVPEVIKYGRVIDMDEQHGGKNINRYLVVAPVEVRTADGGAERQYVGALIQRDGNTQRFYLHEALTQKEIASRFTTGADANGNGTPGGTQSLYIKRTILNALEQKSSQNTGNNAAKRNPVTNAQSVPLQSSSSTPIIADGTAGGNTQFAQEGGEDIQGIVLPTAEEAEGASNPKAMRGLVLPGGEEAQGITLPTAEQAERASGRTEAPTATGAVLPRGGDDSQTAPRRSGGIILPKATDAGQGGLDGGAQMQYAFDKETEREGALQHGGKEESREAFRRRAAGEGLTVLEGDRAAYGFRRAGDAVESGDRGRAAQAARAGRELKALGIDAEVIDGAILRNRDGVTITREVPEAVTVDGRHIFVSAAATLAPRNIAGHEGFHLWKNTPARNAYVETLQDNLDFSNRAFQKYQSIIAKAYLGEEADLSDAGQMRKLQEELFAYISGDIHEGSHDDQLRPMFRNYDAVKAAWQALVEQQRGQRSAEESTLPQNDAEVIRWAGQRMEELHSQRGGTEGYRGTPATDKLGIKIERPIADLGISQSLRGKEKARYQAGKELDRTLKTMRATEDEIKFARMVAKGEISPEWLPPMADRARVREIAEAMEVYQAFQRDGIRAQKERTNWQFDAVVEKLIRNSDEKRTPGALSLNGNTMQRNNERVWGKDAAEINAELFDPVTVNEAERIRFVNRNLEKIDAYKLTKDESAQVQRLMEGDTTEAELRAAGYDTARLKQAADTLTGLYGDFYEAINDFLVAHGYREIGFQKHYAPHMQEEQMGTLQRYLTRLGFQDAVWELPTNLAGRTDAFRPGKQYNPFFQHRVGNKVDYDAVGGFERYVNYLSNVFYHTDDIQKLRRFSEALRRKYSSEELSAELDRLNLLEDRLAEEDIGLPGRESDIPTARGAVLPTAAQQQKAASTGETAIQDYQRAEHHGTILDSMRANLSAVAEMQPVSTLTGQEFQRSESDKRSLRQRVIEFFNSIGNKVTRSDLGAIELNTAGVRDSLAHGYGKLKASTFAALPQVLEQGRIIEHNGPYEGHNYDSYIISAPVQVNGETVYVGVLVIKDTKQRYKLHEVLTASESGAPLFQSESTGQGASVPLRNDTPLRESGDSPTTPIIADGAAGGNTQFAQEGGEDARSANAMRGMVLPGGDGPLLDGDSDTAARGAVLPKATDAGQAGFDGGDEMQYVFGKETDREGALPDGGKEESREAFRRRADSEGFEVLEGDRAAYGYRTPEKVHLGARQIQGELKKLGIEAAVTDGTILQNSEGKSSQYLASDAATAEGKYVFINNATEIPPRTAAGHEAFHAWKYAVARKFYVEVIKDNLDYSSKDFLHYQSAIAKAYLGEEADISDAGQMRRLQEELFAYISGDIHEGTNDDRLRRMFRNYEEVKAAWQALVETQSRQQNPKAMRGMVLPGGEDDFHNILQAQATDTYGATPTAGPVLPGGDGPLLDRDSDTAARGAVLPKATDAGQAGFDGGDEMQYVFGKEADREGALNDGGKEAGQAGESGEGYDAEGTSGGLLWGEGTEGSYTRRAEENSRFRARNESEGKEIRQVGETTYAYRDVPAAAASGNASAIYREFERLGIQAFVHDGWMEASRGGITTESHGQASTLRDGTVGILNGTDFPARLVAGHEMYHVAERQGRAVGRQFRQTLNDNLDFSSQTVQDYISFIAQEYFGKEYDLSRDWNGILEEMAGAISGDLYDGTRDMAGLFLNEQAVRDAWQAMRDTFGVEATEQMEGASDPNAMRGMTLPGGEDDFHNILQAQATDTYGATPTAGPVLPGGESPLLDGDSLQDLRDAAYRRYENMSRFGRYVSVLDDYTNILAGKQAKFDRSMESALGRTALNFGRGLQNAFARAAVLGNLSSAINQTVQIPQLIAEVGPRYTAQATADAATGKLGQTGFISESDFLTGKRGIQSIGEKSVGARVYDIASKPFELVDDFASQVIVRAKYLQQVAEGKSHKEALRAADEFAARLVGNRMKGAKPVFFEQKNLLSKLFSTFQLEVANSWAHLTHDLPMEIRHIAETQGKGAAVKRTAELAAASQIVNFIANIIIKSITGREPVPFDGLGMMANMLAAGYGITKEEWLMRLFDNATEAATGNRTLGTERGDGKRNTLHMLQAAGEDVLEDLPYVSNLTSMLGITDGRLPLPQAFGKKLRSGAGHLLGAWDEGDGEGMKQGAAELVHGFALDASTWLPMGNQIKKTAQGVTGLLRGGAYTGYGEDERLQYSVERSPQNILRGALFGKSALLETETYYAEGRTALTAAQTGVYKALVAAGVANTEAYGLLHALRSVKKTEEQGKKEQQVEILQASGLSDEQQAVAYFGLLATDKELETLAALRRMGTEDGAAYRALAAQRLAGQGKNSGTARAEALLEADLEGRQKAALYEASGAEEQAEDMRALERMGIPADCYLEARAQDADMNAFDKLARAGVGKEHLVDMAAAIGALKPDAGALEKCRAAVDTKAPDRDKLAALRALLSESAGNKAAAAYANGVPPAVYVTYRELAAQESGGGSVTQAECAAVLRRMLIPQEMRAVLWQLQNTAWKETSNPFSAAAGGRALEDYRRESGGAALGGIVLPRG